MLMQMWEKIYLHEHRRVEVFVICKFKWAAQTYGYKLPNCLYKTRNTEMWACRETQAALHSLFRVYCFGGTDRLLHVWVHTLPPLTPVGSRSEQPLGKTTDKPGQMYFYRLQVWRSNEQSRRGRIQLERRWWEIMVRKPSSCLRNNVPPWDAQQQVGKSRLPVLDCLWRQETLWSEILTLWERNHSVLSPLCLCLPVAPPPGEAVMLALALHRDWVRQCQAWGRKHCFSSFGLKRTLALTCWLPPMASVQTFVSFNTSLFFSLLSKGLSPGESPLLFPHLFWLFVVKPDKTYTFSQVHSNGSQKQSLQPTWICNTLWKAIEI